MNEIMSGETTPTQNAAFLSALSTKSAGAETTDEISLSAPTSICEINNGWINAVFVGCDRVAANGDSCNKIGTSGVAILAKYYGIPFYVLGLTSTIDMSIEKGEDIVIEQRPPEEITEM